MSQLIEVKVPDIGDFDAVPVIELFVKVGDTIAVDDAIATLESDKATMDVPSSHAGVVKEVLVSIGDKVSEGSVLIKVEAAGAAAAAPAPAVAAAAPAGNVKVEEAKPNNFNIFYTVQFKTLTSEASVENLKRWYSGKEFVEMNRHDQYYRYSVGRFYSVDDARRFISREKMNGFVVAYRGDERIAVVQARAIVGR